MTATFLEELETAAPLRAGNEPAWLVALRQSAWDRFNAIGLPTTRNEDWRFTSVAPITKATFARAGAPGSRPVPAELLDGLRLPNTTELVFVNGYLVPSLSDVNDAGFSVTSLAPALRRGEPDLPRTLGQVAGFTQNGFTALNTALFTDGTLIRIRSGQQALKPLHLLYLSLPEEQPTVSYPRVLIIAEQSSEATVIESYSGPADAQYFTNAVTEISLADNAAVEHIRIQRESERAFHIATVEARQGRDTRFRSFSLAMGGALARANIYSIMDGTGSDCSMNGLYLLHGTQHVDHQTRIEHAQPNCTSREIYKGVLDGTSHAVFNGKVYVRAVAQKTDGKQTNNNLLLSDGAKVDTKPQLEIFADDVKCTHGATVGRLDDLAVFYLESRGIRKSLARKLLTYGFAVDVLSTIPHEEIRHRLERLVFQRLDFPVV
ncbi:MAG: Fe-S cluster assembly protein SufD [Gemmatimonadota bacterium]